MAVVYATLADGGWRNSPIAITKVVFPDGHVDTNWGRPHRVKVLSEGVTGEETRILHLNVESGTATRSAIDCRTAAKTGTTSELVDAWLDGYNSEYSTVVWMGYPNRRVSMTDVHGEPQQGGYLPAEIWHQYMAAVTEGHPCAPLHESNAGISFRPFYGKYASTGRTQAASEPREETTGPLTPRRASPPRRKRESVPLKIEEAPAPKAEPPAPKAEPPAPGATGGAGPGSP